MAAPLNDDEGIDYANPNYWNDRYAEIPTPFDWYLDWSKLRDTLKPLILGGETVLNLGCGNSLMSFDMLTDGFSKIVNIDISHVVIHQMQERNVPPNPRIEFYVMDIQDLKFPKDSFDIVIEKGTLDAITCTSIYPEIFSRSFSEVYRVLKSVGIFISISHEGSSVRIQDYSAAAGSVFSMHEPIPVLVDDDGKLETFYIYLFTKSGQDDDDDDDSDN